MAISGSRREAARTEGQSGQGPVSPQPRQGSAGNALKHGLTGRGIFLTELIRAKVEEMTRVFVAMHRPRDTYELEMVERAALNAARWHHLIQLEDDLGIARTLTAVEDVRDRLREEVDVQTARLAESPRDAVRTLRRSALGCMRMANYWGSIHSALLRDGRLDPADARRVQHLLGYNEANMSEATAATRDVCRMAERLALPDAPPTRADDLAAIRDLAAEQRQKLLALAETHRKDREEPLEELAPSLAFVDHSAEGRRIARYRAEADRGRRRALQDLEAHRAKYPVDAKDEPICIEPSGSPTVAVAPPPPPAIQESPPPPRKSSIPVGQASPPPADLPDASDPEEHAGFAGSDDGSVHEPAETTASAMGSGAPRQYETDRRRRNRQRARAEQRKKRKNRRR